jgi:hypothetical protein
MNRHGYESWRRDARRTTAKSIPAGETARGADGFLGHQSTDMDW